MDFKYEFTLLAIGVVIAGVVPFAIGADVEPSMEIDMLIGQTQYPFRIQDNNNQNIFAVTPQGGFDPLPVTTQTITLDDVYFGELNPVVYSESLNTIVTETTESGAGIYHIEYTITEDDLDSVDSLYGIFTKDQFVPFVTVQMENIGVGSISANWSIWINDVEIYQSSDPTVPVGEFVRAGWSTGGNYYDKIAGYDFLDVGDTIGVKIWTNTSNDLRINHEAIIISPRITFQGISFYIDDQHDEDSPLELRPVFPFTPTTIQGQGGCYGIGMWDVFDGNLVGDHWTGVTGAKYYHANQLTSIQSLSLDSMYWLESNCLFNTPDTFTYTVWK